jgi:hypothetical protein
MRDAQEQLPFRAPNIIFRYTTEELPSLATQYTTSKGAATPLHVPGDREVAPGSSKVASSNITTQDAKKDAKGGKKMKKSFP